MDKSPIGKNIAKRRKELNMTQEELAENSDLSINFISRIERGSSTQISANSLYRISKALNVVMEDIMSDSFSLNEKPGPNQAKLIAYLNELPLTRSERLSNQILDLLNNYHIN